jgi:hypothetical protein
VAVVPDSPSSEYIFMLRLYRLGVDGQYGAPVVCDQDARITFDCLPAVVLRACDVFDGAPDTTA